MAGRSLMLNASLPGGGVSPVRYGKAARPALRVGNEYHSTDLYLRTLGLGRSFTVVSLVH